MVEKDVNSKSDPFVVVYVRDKINSSHFNELGRTEVAKDNSYPTFAKQFKLDYYFEEEQILRFDVYDENKKGSNHLKDHDFIGTATITLGELMHEKKGTKYQKQEIRTIFVNNNSIFMQRSTKKWMVLKFWNTNWYQLYLRQPSFMH